MADAKTWWRWLRQWRAEHLQVDRPEVLAHIGRNATQSPSYLFMVMMACGIALLGLLQNSVAVIIGAMLISPLMGPIVGLGMSLAVLDYVAMRQSLRTLAVGVAMALVIAVLIVLVSPLREATPEILGRTQPTLFDLLVAVFSGLAGAYATINRKGETIVGVAIATALMPPLAVVGFGLATWNLQIAGGAAFLFMTNLLAIAFSVTAMARWYMFGTEDSPKQSAWRVAVIVGAFVLLSAPLGLALRDIAQRSVVQHAVRIAMDDAARAAGGRVSSVAVNREDERYLVEGVMLVPARRADVQDRLEARLEKALGRPVSVDVQQVLTADPGSLAGQADALAQMRESIAQLQRGAATDQQRRSAEQQANERLSSRLLDHLGDVERVNDTGTLRLRLSSNAGMSLGAARTLEQALQGEDGSLDAEVIPPLQTVPAVVFAAGSEALDEEAQRALDTIAWALGRWNAGPVRVEVVAARANDAVAVARANAVAEALKARGAAVQGVSVVTDGARDTARIRLQSD